MLKICYVSSVLGYLRFVFEIHCLLHPPFVTGKLDYPHLSLGVIQKVRSPGRGEGVGEKGGGDVIKTNMANKGEEWGVKHCQIC
jgi:hypothetical protein